MASDQKFKVLVFGRSILSISFYFLISGRLDDGGVPHAYSQLMIVDEMMDRVNERKNSSLKPCDVFHLICGSGMGG